MAKKLSGFFDLPAPTEADLPAARHADFPFLRHFPGAALRADLTRTSNALELRWAKRDINVPASAFSVAGPTVTKVYVHRHPMTTFKQWMAYRLALRNAGWTVVDEDPGYLDNTPWLLARHTSGDATLWARLEFQTSGSRFTVTKESAAAATPAR